MSLMQELISELKDEIDDQLYEQSCGCPDCDTNVRHGHAWCSSSKARLLELEELGIIRRAYLGSGWKWFCVSHKVGELLNLLEEL